MVSNLACAGAFAGASVFYHDGKSPDQTEWLRLGYVLIAFCFCPSADLYRVGARSKLSEDEAYKWFFGPNTRPLAYVTASRRSIAYTQFLGTHLWGDNRVWRGLFSSPRLLRRCLSVLVLRFLNRQAGAASGGDRRAGPMTVTPLTALGAHGEMTEDPLSVPSIGTRRD